MGIDNTTFLRQNIRGFINENKGVVAVLQKEIGVKIKRLRNKKEMTLEQLGEKLGVTKGYIHHMENGNRKIGISFLENIADIFDVELYHFFTNKQLIEINNETIELINMKKEWDRQEITIDDINTWIEIANSRMK